jgi:hypothetical protein
MNSSYRIWQDMLQRCTNPNRPTYRYYGGRGIAVCERWRSFQAFVSDMGERPDGGSLDRINNDGNYEPGNCRWATTKEQARNRRSNRMLEIDGERMPVVVASERWGVPRYTLYSRLYDGWSDADAAKTPVRAMAQKRFLTHEERAAIRSMTGTERSVANAFGVSQGVVHRIRNGQGLVNTEAAR